MFRLSYYPRHDCNVYRRVSTKLTPLQQEVKWLADRHDLEERRTEKKIQNAERVVARKKQEGRWHAKRAR